MAAMQYYVPETANGISSKQRIGLNLYNCERTTLNSKSTHLPGVRHHKPNCSYNCLIGMALKGSKRKCLPVNEIYSFFFYIPHRNEFPYFRNSAPEGWKNSIRHSLSLGPYFRKTQVAGFQGKKGFQWEIIPDKLPALEQEITKFLAEKGKMPQYFGIELPIHRSTRAVIDTARMETVSSKSVHHSVATPSSSEECNESKSEYSIPPKEEIVGILAYLKDGVPQEGSAALTTTSDSVCNSQNGFSGKTANEPQNINSEVTDKLAQVCGDSVLLGEWLNLELADNIDIDDINENAELDSLLITDCLGMNLSLNEVNWSDHAHKSEVITKNSCTQKCVNTRQKECSTNCITIDDWLEPADDWNQWNEPAYVERMINLTNSLQTNTISHLNVADDATEMDTTDSSILTEKNSFYKSKIKKCLGRNNYASKTSKRVKKCNRKRLINDHRKIYVHKFAAAAEQNTLQSISCNMMDNCTLHTDESTSGCLERSDKCLKSFQLIVSISFDNLVTVRHLKQPSHA